MLRMTRVRRLFYEAYVTFAATMKHRVEREDDGPVKKMPKLERDQRLKAVREKVTGLMIENELEPASQ
eukprot:1048471-Amphidinium_carterae.1